MSINSFPDGSITFEELFEKLSKFIEFPENVVEIEIKGCRNNYITVSCTYFPRQIDLNEADQLQRTKYNGENCYDAGLYFYEKKYRLVEIKE